MQIVDIDTERKSIAIVIITVAAIPARPGTFTAHLDGRPIVTSRQPFLDAARELLKLGHLADAIIIMRHAGSEIDALRSTIGKAARLTVKEAAAGRGPRFAPWNVFRPCPVASPMAPQRAAATLDAVINKFAYEADVEEFCSQIGKIRASLDFEVSARGWCYILEEHGATKADFPTIERLFVALRKSGNLPLDICAEDEARAADHLEELDHETPVQGWIDHLRENAHKGYNPVSLWEDSEYYIEMWVEKIDLKSLFSDLCKRYTIPLINIRGEANALVVRPEAGRQLCLDAIQRYTPDALLADFETRRAEAQIEAREAIGRLFEVRP
jgi:hypothetical protein